MGIDDKANYTVIHRIGAAREAAGRLTGSQELKREGRNEQAQARLLEAGERVKDAGRKLKEGFSKD